MVYREILFSLPDRFVGAKTNRDHLKYGMLNGIRPFANQIFTHSSQESRESR